MSSPQWNAAAEAYAQRAEELIAELRRHVETTMGRQGRRPDLPSTLRLRSAVDAFNDAEFDWCGSRRDGG